VFTNLDLTVDRALEQVVGQVEPVTASRAITRFQHRLSDLVFFDAALEGASVTLPEVVTLLEGKPIKGHTREQVQLVLDLKGASNLAINLTRSGPLVPQLVHFDQMHAALMSHNSQVAGAFRGHRPRKGMGPIVQLGPGELFHAAPDNQAEAVFHDGLAVIEQIDHPVIRAVTLAGFATYHQFYRDGNKRVGRYIMNTVLMSHGYDAILVPATDKEHYEDALVSMYRTGRVEPYTTYLLGLWLAGAGHPAKGVVGTVAKSISSSMRPSRAGSRSR
jgi:Fic family protein